MDPAYYKPRSTLEKDENLKSMACPPELTVGRSPLEEGGTWMNRPFKLNRQPAWKKRHCTGTVIPLEATMGRASPNAAVLPVLCSCSPASNARDFLQRWA